MAEAKKGDNVKVHYTGKLDDGTVFDSSQGKEPLEFQVGSGNVIPGFENAVVGMSEGETRTTRIPADEAYGPYQEENVITVSRDEFPPELDPQVGEQLQVKQGDGQSYVVRVKQVSDNDVTLDANHPLAGQALTFDIELVQIA